MRKPFYSRYTQVGKDINGYPVGAPSADKTGKAQGWKFIQAVPGRAEQVAEWNEVQEMLQDQIRDVGDYLLKDGQTVGLQIRVDKFARTAFIEWQDPARPGKVYAFGLFHVVPEVSVPIEAVGTETISVKIVKRVITELEDPSLVDPVVGEENFGSPGAYRWVYDVIPVVKNNANRDQYAGTYDLWTLQDGEVRTSANDQTSEVDRNLIKYTDDITGDCLVRGMRVRVEDENEDTLRVIIDRGRAYVGGKPVGYETTTTRTIAKAKFETRSEVEEFVSMESRVSPEGVPELKTKYTLRQRPIKTITRLVAPVVIRKKVQLGRDPFDSTTDPYEFRISTNLSSGYGSVVDVLDVYDPVTDTHIVSNWNGSVLHLNSLPAGSDVYVTWVFKSLLTYGVDYRISSDQYQVEFLRNYPAALDNGSFVQGQDSASFVYPGLALRRIAAPVAIGATQITLDSVYGLKIGEVLTLKGTDTEQVTVKEVLTATNKIVLVAPTVHAYQTGDSVYAVETFTGGVGLTLRSPSDSQFNVDYSWMLDRVDVVYIDSDNNILVQSGQSNKPAYEPSIPQGVLPLAALYLPANANASGVTIKKFDVQRLNQADLQKLLKRVENAEYNASIQNLKIASYNKATAAGLALRGILTDAFVNSDVIDIVKTDPAPAVRDVSIDPDHGLLTPTLDMVSANLTVDTVKSTCFIGKQSATMEHTLVGSNLVVNKVVTDVEAIRGASNPPKPVLAISTGHYTGAPARSTSFPFVNAVTRQTDVVPGYLEGGFWRTRQARVPWLEQRALYLPSLTLDLNGRHLPPNSTFGVTIDGFRLPDVTLTTGPLGEINNASVTVPAGVVSAHNSRTVALVDGLTGRNVIASTLFGATPSETSFLPVAYDSMAANALVPMAQTFVYEKDTYVRGVNLYFAQAGQTPIEVQIRTTNAQGQPGTVVLAHKRLTASQINTAGATVVTFDDPVFCQANVAYALAFVTSSDDYVVKKAVLGRTDTTGAIVASKPLAQGALYTSLDGLSWTVQTESALTFQMLECNFSADPTRNLLVFQPIEATDLGLEQIRLIVARAQQLVPRGAAIDWSYSVNDREHKSAFLVDPNGSLDPQILSESNVQSITLYAHFRGTAAVSGMVGRSNGRLLVFTPRQTGVYTSRAALHVPDYRAARVTLELSAQSSLDSVDSVAVRFSNVDDPYGVASCTFSGVPKFGDEVVITSIPDEVNFSFTYYPSGAASLSDLVGQLVNAAEAAIPVYDLSYTLQGIGDDQTATVTFRRKTLRAFVPDELMVQVVPASGSELAVGNVLTNYIRLVHRPGFTQVDDQFSEYTFDNGETPINSVRLDPNNPNSNVFRVQVELTSRPTDHLVYPRVRNLAVIVSNN